MFNDLKNFEQNDFGMSEEDLEKWELRFSIHWIYDILSPEQLFLVDEKGKIMSKHLTTEQREIAKQIQSEDNYFAERFARISGETFKEVWAIMKK